MDPTIAAKLRASFPIEAVGKLPKVTCPTCSDPKQDCKEHKRAKCRTCKAYVSTQHIHVDFVGHAHVTERLLDVDLDWDWEPLAFNSNGLPALDDIGGLWIRLTIGGKTRLGYGHTPKRGGDAMKELIGDAIRNAGMRFGIALDFWKKDAPEAGEGVPARQVERPPQTPDDRAKELRGQIAAIGKARGKDVATIGGEFAAWSRGEQDIRSASVAVLVEYKDHLERGGE